MPEQHKKILAALGLPAAQIDALEALTPEQVKDFKIEDYVTPIKTNLQTQFLNDDAFLEGIPEEKTSKTVKKKIESSQYARFMNELKDVAKEMGIEYDDLSPEDQKSIKGFYRETQKKGLSKAGNATALVEIQNKLSEALAAKTALETGTDKKVQDAIAAEAKKYSEKLEKAASLSILNGKTKIKPEYVVDRAISKVKEKYTAPFNPETMMNDLKQKNHPQLDVTRGDGTIMTYAEALIEAIKEDEVYKEPESDKDKPKPTTVTVNGDATKTVIPEYIQKNMNVGLKEEAAHG